MNFIAFKCYMPANQCRLILPLKIRSAIVSAIRYPAVAIKRQWKTHLEENGNVKEKYQEELIYCNT